MNNGSKFRLRIATIIILVSMSKKTLSLELATKVLILPSYMLILGINILQSSYNIKKLKIGIITINKALTIEINSTQ